MKFSKSVIIIASISLFMASALVSATPTLLDINDSGFTSQDARYSISLSLGASVSQEQSFNIVQDANHAVVFDNNGGNDTVIGEELYIRDVNVLSSNSGPGGKWNFATLISAMMENPNDSLESFLVNWFDNSWCWKHS